MARDIWAVLAEHNGWAWQPAYNGYVRPDYHPGGPRNEWRSYPSDVDAEEACAVDGIETEEQAWKAIADCEGCRVAVEKGSRHV